MRTKHPDYERKPEHLPSGSEAESTVTTPLVSVIVPVFNGEKYLERCLDSLACQTFSNYEIICVDDGSTDGSWKMLKKIAAASSRMQILSIDNQGPSTARNIAYRRSQGEYITFVDADDYVTDDFLEILVRVITEDEADIALGNKQTLRPSDGRVTRDKKLKRRVIDNRRAFASSSLIEQAAVHAKMFRRDFLESHGILFPEDGAYQDHPHWVHCLSWRPRISVFPQIIYTWARNAESMSAWQSVLEPARIQSRFYSMGSCIEAAERSGIQSLIRRVYSLQLNRYLVRHLLALADARHALSFRQAAFEQLSSGVATHRKAIDEHTEGWQRLLYELLLRGSLQDLIKVVEYLRGQTVLATEIRARKRKSSSLRVMGAELPSLPSNLDPALLEISPVEGLERRTQR